MPRIDYTGKAITGERRQMVRVAERICSDLAADGYDLTLRQLYYQHRNGPRPRAVGGEIRSDDERVCGWG